jgi:tripartite-type tricarboxylate transporter receptor subunit TctC
MLASMAGLAALPLMPLRHARAAEWTPTRTIRLVVPYGPGGSSDIIARAVAAEMGKRLGQQVVVDNKGGGAGTVAMQEVAHAEPDGYTLVLGHVGVLAVNPFMMKSLPYDAERDFAPITLLAKVPMIFVAGQNTPVASVKDYVALAKAKPHALSYGSAGNGSAGHLAFEMLKQATATDVLHVPYKGTGAQMTDLLGGTLDFASAGLPPFFPHIKAGKLRCFAVGSAQRMPPLPDVPTVAEQGYPGFESSQWFGLLVPKKTPAPVIERVHQAALQALASDAVKARLAEDASVAAGYGPAQFADFIRSEQQRWGELVVKAHLKAE